MQNKLNFEKVGPMKLPSRIGGGTFDLYLYIFEDSKANYFVLEKGSVKGKEDVLVRIDSNCVWADIFGSARCDCAEQLHAAMRMINDNKEGLLIHAYDQDGRGISLKDHVKVYMLQDQGYDTVEADFKAGFTKPDRRNYDEVLVIMKDFEIKKSVKLITNNPHRITSLKEADYEVTRIPVEVVPLDKWNAAQLVIKKKKMGHLFSFDIDNPELQKLTEDSIKRDCFSEYTGYKWIC